MFTVAPMHENSYQRLIIRFAFDDAKAAFAATRAGKGPDGKAVIKAVISGPDVPIDES